jgi:hypothetical protein
MAYIGDSASGYEELSGILIKISGVEQLVSSRVYQLQFTHNTISRIRSGEVSTHPPALPHTHTQLLTHDTTRTTAHTAHTPTRHTTPHSRSGDQTER